MNRQKLMRVTYYDPKNSVRLTGYSDTAVWDETGQTLIALRFGGYPEEVRGLADAIYGGVTIEIENGGSTLHLKTLPKQYRRELNHDGLYAEATLIAQDDSQNAPPSLEEDGQAKQDLPPRVYLFCPPGDREALFRQVDQKTAVPLIPEFQDYFLDQLIQRNILRPLRVCSRSRKMEAWTLRCEAQDKNIAAVLEEGLKTGAITIPGGAPGPSPLDGLDSVTDYLNTFGVTVAERIKNLFVPLFDPAREPLSPEVLEINRYIQEHAGYSLYDAQLAVSEAIKRQLQRGKVGLIVAECGSGKTKLGTVSIAAVAAGVHAQQRKAGHGKAFHVVLCPSHATKKWVREIEETVPDAFAAVVHSIQEFDHLYQLFDRGTKSCFAVLSKEKARDGYMRAPAVVYRRWNREGLPIARIPPLPDGSAENESPRTPVFCCPSCGAVVMMDISRDGTVYRVPANSLYFRREHGQNHKCEACGESLWTALNPDAWRRQTLWGKIGGYGFVYRPLLPEHLRREKGEAFRQKLLELSEHPGDSFPAKGANRACALSTYIKKKYKGKIYGLIVDELHQYNNKSGQGDAMAELYGTAKKVVGMTATLINGYSSGIFHLLYRLAPARMEQDGQSHEAPSRFDSEYGVIQNTYEEKEPEYNTNRRTVRTKKAARLLPGVSPLVYSRFLMEQAVFLSLTDLGKELPEYEEIPIPISMPEDTKKEYDRIEQALKRVLKNDRKAARKILSAYLNLLTAYPDQPYGHGPLYHPISGNPIVEPKDTAVPNELLPKDEALLEIAERKIAAGERVLIYTNWTRLDTQHKLLDLCSARGWRTEILPAKVKPDSREAWVSDRLNSGLQVLIANPSLVETGLDLNAFTTLIFYDIGYKLFTLRQASRRSWRINQTAPRVEVYLLYYQSTMQHKAIKLMASKLAVAGIIEGSFSEEGLAAMSECEDMTTMMAKELMLGIRDSVEDVAETFKRMALLKPKAAEPSAALEASQPREEAPAQKPEASVTAAVSPLLWNRTHPVKKHGPPELSMDQTMLFQIA
ncbi:MAG: hypothetical protein HFF18_07520 [Oscillospiraceae bacterium]|nr:hypothetical protein [Oscillospiraceae bacterium]